MTFDLNSVIDLATGLVALAAALLGYRNSRKITNLHVLVNSRLSELVTAEHAAGVGEGIAQERGEARERSALVDS
jgi:hypothetical protein